MPSLVESSSSNVLFSSDGSAIYVDRVHHTRIIQEQDVRFLGPPPTFRNLQCTNSHSHSLRQLRERVRAGIGVATDHGSSGIFTIQFNFYIFLV
jgi:hypothetical protein